MSATLTLIDCTRDPRRTWKATAERKRYRQTTLQLARETGAKEIADRLTQQWGGAR